MGISLCTLNSKIYLDVEEFHLDLKKWKSQGERLVFTNGCFDLLHRGHVTYLIEASHLGTKLIIGLNSDSSVKGLKGDTRPINKMLDRAFMLASYDFVDAVVIFDTPTPLSLIERIQPHILVKGGDYDLESIVGFDVITAYGGKVMTLPFVDNYSTTSIIEKMKSNSSENLILNDIISIENQLERLNKKYSNYYENYLGDSFLEQSDLSVDLENLIIQITHEMSTEIGFLRRKLYHLMNYIEFRIVFYFFSDTDLELIIDKHDLNPIDKNNLSKKIQSNVFDEINKIRKEWNMIFNNLSYQKIKSIIK